MPSTEQSLQNIQHTLTLMSEALKSLTSMIRTGFHSMTTALDALSAQEVATEAAVDAAVAKISAMIDEIRADAAKIADLSAAVAAAQGNDHSAALADLTAKLKAKTDALSAAVAADASAAPAASIAPASPAPTNPAAQ
jgi:hypothetical protein